MVFKIFDDFEDHVYAPKRAYGKLPYTVLINP